MQTPGYIQIVLISATAFFSSSDVRKIWVTEDRWRMQTPRYILIAPWSSPPHFFPILVALRFLRVFLFSSDVRNF